MLSKPLTRYIFALALILLGSQADKAPEINMNHICALLTNTALVASGTSCTSYYSCFNGVATLQNCPKDTYFDKNSQACVAQAPSYCNTSVDNLCLGKPVGSFVAKHGSCNDFYYCSSKGAELNNCPSHLVFNPIAQTCTYKSIYPCDEQTNANTVNANVTNLCSCIQNGIYFGNAFNCASWQKCNNDNSFTTGTCKNGLVFDTANVICNYPSAVKCSQLSYDPSLDVNSAASGGSCSTNGAIKPATACNQYYQCISQLWVLKNCIGNLYFDTKTGQCMSRLQAYNNCDRCVGTTLPFVNAFGTNCTGYLVCGQGVERSASICTGGLYFSEILGGCSNINPQFPFCRVESTTTTAPTSGTTTSGEATTDASYTTTDAPSTTTEKSTETSTVKPTTASTAATETSSGPTATSTEASTEAPTNKPNA